MLNAKATEAGVTAADIDALMIYNVDNIKENKLKVEIITADDESSVADSSSEVTEDSSSETPEESSSETTDDTPSEASGDSSSEVTEDTSSTTEEDSSTADESSEADEPEEPVKTVYKEVTFDKINY